MSLKWLPLALIAALQVPAWAKPKAKAKAKHEAAKEQVADHDGSGSDDDASVSDDAGSDDSDSTTDDASDDDGSDTSDGSDDSQGEKPAAEPTPAQLVKKQDLTGHDLGGTKPVNTFEKNRFFVDKLDTRKTLKTTLIQGSVTSTSFLYNESGGGDASQFQRIFTDLRLQTDFRHISGGRWDARVDARVRLVNQPTETLNAVVMQPGQGTTSCAPGTPATTACVAHIQSGLTGQNEYDLRELWAVRNGERTDVFIGRQYIPDLAAVKIDGVRVDYASSQKLTFLGFGGLYPLRGSRSVTTDYPALKTLDGTSAGRFVGAAGFGGAYRTPVAYGSLGAVALVPLKSEIPRIFLTSNGYWRYGSKLDLYHFVLVDLIGKNDALGAGNAGLTNLSVGANIKPTDRLRFTASFNRVDTDTLDIQAGAFLQTPDNVSVVENEIYWQRLSTNELRGSASAGLGAHQRFELTAAASFRFHPSFAVTIPGNATGETFPAGQSIELYASAIDKHSFKDMRIGADVVRSFGVGGNAFARSELLALRLFARREIRGGRGEWDAEIAYSNTKDTPSMDACQAALMPIPTAGCFGNSTGTLIDAGGNVFYRFGSNWFGVVSAYLTHTDLSYVDRSMMTPVVKKDPSILGISGFFRAAYRF